MLLDRGLGEMIDWLGRRRVRQELWQDGRKATAPAGARVGRRARPTRTSEPGSCKQECGGRDTRCNVLSWHATDKVQSASIRYRVVRLVDSLARCFSEVSLLLPDGSSFLTKEKACVHNRA